MDPERSRPISDPNIPDGYSVTYHEIRGYDSPDRWFSCEGPMGWKKDLSTRRRAIEACQKHAEALAGDVPNERGHMRCYLCRGAKDLTADGEPCTVCGGLNIISVEVMAQTHDGRVRLAQIVGPMLEDGALPAWLKLLDPRVQSGVITLARNPCKVCGTWLLEPGWVGSAYCSRRCCIEDHKHDPGYAKKILHGYEEERKREAAMLAMGSPPT